MTEEWRDIPQFAGKYQASTLGRIRSLDREVKNKHGKRTIKGKVMSPSITGAGYLSLTISINQRRHYFDVHRLVAAAFYGDANGRTVNHKDGNKLNNKKDNLEYMTQSENNIHARDILGVCFGRSMAGKNNPMFGKKHSQETIEKIRQKALNR